MLLQTTVLFHYIINVMIDCFSSHQIGQALLCNCWMKLRHARDYGDMRDILVKIYIFLNNPQYNGVIVFVSSKDPRVNGMGGQGEGQTFLSEGQGQE